jgi:hypothetical protein
MTPLIAEIIGFFTKEKEDVPLLDDSIWFDIAEPWNSIEDESNGGFQGLRNPLPFSKCAVVGRDEEGGRFLVFALDANRPVVEKGQEGIYGLAVSGVYLKNEGYLGAVTIPPFFCDPRVGELSNGVTIYFNQDRDDNQKSRSIAQAALLTVSFWLNLVNKQIVHGYRPTKRSNHAKRIRQGKKPLFDWHTVVLEPRSVKESEALGGTHSSPRQHDVRGHWVVRNNKRYWRKPHKRGDASLGVIFKDYQLKGERNADL